MRLHAPVWHASLVLLSQLLRPYLLSHKFLLLSLKCLFRINTFISIFLSFWICFWITEIKGTFYFHFGLLWFLLLYHFLVWYFKCGEGLLRCLLQSLLSIFKCIKRGMIYNCWFFEICHLGRLLYVMNGLILQIYLAFTVFLGLILAS